MNEDIKSLMGEAPHGVAPEVPAEGFQIVDPSRITTDAGMTAHRGVLQDGEYVDFFLLREAAEAELGFSYADVSAAYKGGRPTAEQRQLRDRIDSRLLALSRSKGNLQQAAKLLGLNESTVDRAVRRARAVEVSPIVKNPAVTHRLSCFTCESMEAEPRKRRFSKSPPQWTGTVNLCDDCFTHGHDHHPGNPAYWEHRLATAPIRGSHTPPPKRTQTFPADWPSELSYAEFTADMA